MPGMTMREFACALCRRTFERLAGDLMVPGPDLCVACLREVWEMDDDALAEHVAERMSGSEVFPVSDVVQYVRGYTERWADVEEAIRSRERLDWWNPAGD